MEQHDRWAHRVKDHSINQFGRIFKPGRPLSDDVKEQIIRLDNQGVRPYQISLQLNLTKSCVHQILKKYHQEIKNIISTIEEKLVQQNQVSQFSKVKCSLL